MHRLRFHDFAKATDDEAGTNLCADARFKVKKGQLWEMPSWVIKFEFFRFLMFLSRRAQLGFLHRLPVDHTHNETARCNSSRKKAHFSSLVQVMVQGAKYNMFGTVLLPFPNVVGVGQIVFWLWYEVSQGEMTLAKTCKLRQHLLIIYSLPKLS